MIRPIHVSLSISERWRLVEFSKGGEICQRSCLGNCGCYAIAAQFLWRERQRKSADSLIVHFCKSSEHALPAPLSAFHIKTELLIATSVSLCLSVCLFHYTALQLSVSLSVSPFVCLPPVSAPSCPSVYLSVRLYVCLSVDCPSCIVLGYLIRA